MRITRLNQMEEAGRIVKGRWEIGPNHEIQYRSEGKDEEIRLKTPILAAEPGALVIALTTKQAGQKVTTGTARLTGTWHLNAKNRVVFEVGREKGRTDVLAFKGAWRVGRSNEFIYSYEEISLKTKKKIRRELVFSGFWELSDRNRLTYRLAADSDSAFRIRGAFQTQSILAKKGEVRYQAGIEVSGRHKIQTIVLFGKWKLSRDLELLFEMEYAGGGKRAIVFGGEFALGPSSRVTARLAGREEKPLGVELILTKEFLKKDGLAFLRLMRSLEESRVEAGMRFKW
ncbi:MAG: hypothetical protein ACREH5_06700 [Candidatus Omnitrophota bacterium]